MKPKKNEAKQDFLKRCTASMADQGLDDADAYAACNRSWNEAKGKNVRQALSMTAPLEFEQPENDGPRRFLITAFTGPVIDSWFGKLAIDIAGIETEPKMPILRQHMHDRVVGWSDKSWKDDDILYVAGIFSSKTVDGREVLDLADEGFPWQASIGVWPKEVLQIKEGEKRKVNGQDVAGPAEIWTKSAVREVSMVALGRDENTAAISLSESGEVEVCVINQSTEVHDMTLEELKQEHADLVAEIQEAARKQALDDGYAEGSAAATEQTLALAGAVFGEEAQAKLAKLIDANVTPEQYAAVSEAKPVEPPASPGKAMLEAIEAAAPEPVGAASNQKDAKDPESLWEQDENLRAEFGGDKGRYLAWVKANTGGRARILKQ